MKIALLQSPLAWGQVDENLRNFDRKLAAPLGCDMVLLPEMFPAGSTLVKQSFAAMEAEKERLAARYDEVCRALSAWAERQDAAVAGSTVCREGERFYNRLVVAFPDGRRLHYDKRHCFRMGGENEHYASGSERLVFGFRGAKIAAFICYDLRFPVWCRNVEEYDLAFFVANWPAARREAWNALLRARAIENQCYVAGVNCVGEDLNGLAYAGDSALWDARGCRVAAAEPGADEVLVAECDLSALHAFRRKFAVLEDRDHFSWQ